MIHGVSDSSFNELIVSGEVAISFTASHRNIGHALERASPWLDFPESYGNESMAETCWGIYA